MHYPEPAWIVRDLHLEMDLDITTQRLFYFSPIGKRVKMPTLSQLHQVVNDLIPDIVLVWGMWNLPRSLPVFSRKVDA